jgi:hypothetical protein
MYRVKVFLEEGMVSATSHSNVVSKANPGFWVRYVPWELVALTKLIYKCCNLGKVQWASQKKRISYDFHSYVGSMRHIPKNNSVQPLSPPRHNHGDQRIVLVNVAMGSFL